MPSGINPMASFRSPARWSADTTTCTLPSPPHTTTRRPPLPATAASQSSGLDVATTSTSARSRSAAIAASTASSWALPAEALVITSSLVTTPYLAARSARQTTLVTGQPVPGSQRSGRKNSRMFAATRPGSSLAVKCPPRGSSFQRRMSR